MVFFSHLVPCTLKQTNKWQSEEEKTRVRSTRIPSVCILMRLHKVHLCLSEVQRWNCDIHPKWLGRHRRESFFIPTTADLGGVGGQAACPCVCVHLCTRHRLDRCWNLTKGKISQQMPHSRRLPVIFTEGKGQVDTKHSSTAASCHRELNFHHVLFCSIITGHAYSHTQSPNSVLTPHRLQSEALLLVSAV